MALTATRIPWLLLAIGCGQDVQDRPAHTFNGSFHAPPIGGGGGDADGGTGGGDGGVPTLTVTGTVVGLVDLGDPVAAAPPVADRQVAGYAPSGVLLTALSTDDGSFRLEGLDRASPVVLSASGDPPSFVVLESSRVDAATLPVLDATFLEDVAASVATAPADVTGHVFLWLQDSHGDPVPGLVVEVVSASPLEGPFYATTEATQLTGEPPTAAEALVVLLNAVASTIELSVYRIEDPTITETVTIPVDAGVVTFYEITTDL